MTRGIVDEQPSVSVPACVRIARQGGRGGPRARRSGRLPSDAPWQWVGRSRGLRGEEETWSLSCSMVVYGTRGLLTLSYRANGVSYEPRVDLTPQRMHLGGVRWWASCPECRRRCASIFVAGPRVACRLCFRLVHRSTRVSASDRAMSEQVRIAEALGELPSLWDAWSEPPDRPSRMTRSRYARIVARYERAQTRNLAGFTDAVNGLLVGMGHAPRW